MDHAEDHITRVRNYFRNGQQQSIPKHTQILLIDEDRPRAMYYIGSGYVRVYSVNSRKEQYTHIIYGPGEIFPLTWLTKQTRSNVLYGALTDCEIYCVELDSFNRDLQKDNGLSYGMLQQAIEQYRLYTMRVDNLEYKYASERLAYRLILLSNRFGERSGDAITIMPPLTHQLLGSSLNLSRESVSREMEKLVRKGLVRYNQARQIVIPDIQSLSKELRVPLDQGLSMPEGGVTL